MTQRILTLAGKGAMKKDFIRAQDSLDPIFAFVDAFMASRKLDESIIFPVKLTIEELFTNLVRHNAGGREHITISLDMKNGALIMWLKDYDVEPFDLDTVEEADTGTSLEERRIGGLGIHLVKSIVDKISYEYANRTMCVTAIKHVEARHV